MANIGRYWILQTDLSHRDFRHQKDVVLEESVSRNSDIQTGDNVFLWSRSDRNLCGLADVAGELPSTRSVNQSGQISISVTPINPSSSEPTAFLRRLSIIPREIFEDGLSISADTVRRIIHPEDFENLLRDRFHAVELSLEQVFAINELLPKTDTFPLNDSPSGNPPSSHNSSIQQDVIGQDNREDSAESVYQEISSENPDSDEKAGSEFNRRLVDAKTIPSYVEQAEVLFELAQQQATTQSMDEAAVALGFANTAASHIEDVDVREQWLRKIGEMAEQYGLKFIPGKEKPESETNNEEQNTVGTQTTTSESDSDAETESDFKTRLTSINADVYTDKDLLGIENDVEAFAQLIAARSVDPPLSIGLFGDWGSGKTFFMRHLRKRVEEIAKDAEDSHITQKDIAFYKRIVQIEFNAWHYSESNLWASLVEHIFQNLRMKKEDTAQELKERQEALLKKLEIENAAQLHAKEKEIEAKEKLEEKERELNAVQIEHDDELEKLKEISGEDIVAGVRTSLALTPTVKEQINEALAATGFPVAANAAGDFQEALSQASTVLNRSSNLVLSLTRASDRNKRFIMLLLVLLAAPVIGILIKLITQHYDLSTFYASFSAIAAFLTSLAVWIRKQAEWASKWIGRIEQAKQEVDKKIETQIAEKKAEQEKEIAGHRQQLELLRTKYSALLREREAAARRVAEVQEELRLSTAAQLLGKFIQDRASSDDYRKHLGLLALIRRDFERISNLLDVDNNALSTMDWEQEAKDSTTRINRIVLYIDDLDRCQPSQVVAVLQAVHLLLAFKLFIVVVGVDCRWVTQSLRKQYPELLRDGQPAKSDPDEKDAGEKLANFHAASSRDYLEKIFQIPFWLNPMTSTSTVNLLKGILESSVVKDKVLQTATQKTPPANVKDGDNGQIMTGRTSESNESGDEMKAHQTTESEEQKSAGKTVSLEKFNLNPKSLNLRERELKFMETLAPILGRSPRSVKRFINIYRLIKVGLSPQEHVEFLKVKSPISQYQAVMILLALETGFPKLSAKLLSVLLDDIESPIQPRQFAAQLSKFGKESPENQEVFSRLFVCIAQAENIKGDMQIDDFTSWAPLISRYSFNTERS